MVLELLIYAKSAIKKFQPTPIRGLHSGHVTSKGGLWLVKNFLLQIIIAENGSNMPNLQLENFDQSQASIVVMWLWMEASDWSKFSNYWFGIFEQF